MLPQKQIIYEENKQKINKTSNSMRLKLPFSKWLKTCDKFLMPSVGIVYATCAPKYSTSTAVGNNPTM